MFAKFISQPISGEFEELIFDIDSIWKSPDWCWVKFTNNNGDEWVGVFRGKPLKTAIAEKINQIAIITSYSIYIIGIQSREVIFHEEQTQFKNIIEMPAKDKFLISDYYQIGILDEQFNFEIIETDFDMDNIKFNNYSGTKLIIEFNKMVPPDYSLVQGYVDITNLTIKIEKQLH